MMKIGIAGWAFHRSILQRGSLTLLDFPALARQEYGVETVELVSEFFESTTAGYLNRLRLILESERVTVHGIAVDQGDITNPDAVVRQTSLEALKQWFYVARAFSVHAKISGYDPHGIQTFAAMDGTKRTQDLGKFLAIVGSSAYRGPLFFEYNFAEADERVAAAKGLAYLRVLAGADKQGAASV